MEKGGYEILKCKYCKRNIKFRDELESHDDPEEELFVHSFRESDAVTVQVFYCSVYCLVKDTGRDLTFPVVWTKELTKKLQEEDEHYKTIRKIENVLEINSHDEISIVYLQKDAVK